MAYQITPFPMTFSDVQGHRVTASLLCAIRRTLTKRIACSHLRQLSFLSKLQKLVIQYWLLQSTNKNNIWPV